MSCITATLERFETTVSLNRETVVNSVCTISTPYPQVFTIHSNDLFIVASKQEQPKLNVQRQSGGTCSLTYICDNNIRAPYLEIEPEVIWVYYDLETYNNV